LGDSCDLGPDSEVGLRGIANYTANHQAAGREMIGVLITDGDATNCQTNNSALAGGADPHDHLCGGVAPPCHYWNVGDAWGDVLANALQAISQQAVPLPCEIDVTGLSAPEGEVLDYGRVNVTFTEGTTVTTIPQAANEAACPTDQPAWHYDSLSAPTKIFLCEDACATVSAAGDGAELNVVAGCTNTIVVQ